MHAPRDVPTESDGVISVTAIGPTTAKADYSNYGDGAETGAAVTIQRARSTSQPRAAIRDGLGTPLFRTPETQILGPYSLSLARSLHEVDGAGRQADKRVRGPGLHGPRSKTQRRSRHAP